MALFRSKLSKASTEGYNVKTTYKTTYKAESTMAALPAFEKRARAVQRFKLIHSQPEDCT
jgi:hypothetical protein